jgi:hypothetical protein
MNPDEQAIADDLYSALNTYTDALPRTVQSAKFQVGISDLGFCSERTRRMIAEIPKADPEDNLKSFIGHAVGDWLERVALTVWPDAYTQAEVALVLAGDGGEYYVTGHPDLIRPDWGVIDVKTDYGLDVIARTGPTMQQMFQRHCYAKAAYEKGLFTIPLEQVKTANVWLDRSGQEQRLHTHVDDYDPWIVAQAAAWLDDVVYAHAYSQEARKEPPREMCAKVCGHFSTCRALDTDATGLLTDDEVLAAIDVIREARRMKREADRMQKAASAKLTGINGSTGKFSVRWVWVNDGDVAYHRDGYYKLDIREM